MVDILGQDDSSHRYPYIYLRDNCPCSDCYFRDSSQHLLDTVREVDLNIIPDKVEINNDGTELSITWPNGHVSLFDSDWLFEKRLLDESKPRAKDSTKVTTRDLGPVSRKTRNLSGEVILFVSSKRKCSVSQNFAVILIFIPFTTYKKTSFTE